jgi:WD40 repeat protein
MPKGVEHDRNVVTSGTTTDGERVSDAKWMVGIAISADGKLLASSPQKRDNAVHLWDLGKEKELLSFVGHRGGPLTVAFLPDGKTVATVSRDGIRMKPVRTWADWSLRLWDAASGKELHAVKEPQDGQIKATAFSHDGTRLVTLRHDGILRAWDVRDGKLVKEWTGPTRESTRFGDVYTVHAIRGIATSPDGETLVTSGYADKTLRFWEVKTGKELRNQKLEVNFPSDRNVILVAEVASGGTRVKYSGQFRGGPAFSPDGCVLVTGGEDGSIQFWHADAENPICALGVKEHLADSFAISRDGKMLASAGWGNTAYVWDAEDALRGKLPQQMRLSPKDLEAAWDGLADADAAKAFRALSKLVTGAANSVPWLLDKAKAFPSTDLSRLDALVKDLGDDSFDTRQKAVENLVTLGSWAGSAVLKELAGDLPSEEARRLAKDVLDKLRSPPPECLREIRTLEVLEQIGTPDAQKALEKLAEGSGPRQDEAKACLERLRKRGVK